MCFFLKPQPKYFHSAAVLGDRMVVYGGRSNTTAQFFSRQLSVYDIKCNSWHLLPGGTSLFSAVTFLGTFPSSLYCCSLVEFQRIPHFSSLPAKFIDKCI